jgi:hypothetical protein
MDASPALPAASRTFRTSPVTSSKPEAVPAEPAASADTIALADLLRQNAVPDPQAATPPREIGGRRDGPEPTRYGDWEKNGRCIDF